MGESPQKSPRGRFARYLLIAIVLLFGTAYAVGSFLPERFEGRSRVVYAKGPEEVWGALLDYDRHPMTGHMKRGVEAQPPENQLPVWKEDMGRGEVITVRTVAAERPRSMVREMESSSLPMTSRWEYTLEPEGDGCLVSIDAVTDIRRGTWHVPFFRVMMVLGGGVEAGLDLQLEMVAETLGVEAQRP